MRDWRIGQLHKLANVSVYFDSQLDAAEVREFGFEHVVVATGSRWRRDGVGAENFRPVPDTTAPRCSLRTTSWPVRR